MASPRRGQKFCPSGGAIYAGMLPPVVPPPEGEPAWLASMELNKWKAISGTAGSNFFATVPGLSQMNAWGSLAKIGDTAELISGAMGGHSDGTNNSVFGINLALDQPVWFQRKASTSNPETSLATPYNPDGSPKSRHGYYSLLYDKLNHRLLLVGARFYNAIPATSLVVDGFDLTTNQWLPAGTYPNVPIGRFGVLADANGDIWAEEARAKLALATNTWSTPTSGSAENPPMFPWALDTDTGMMFGLCFGQGDRSSQFLGIVAAKKVGNVHTPITFAPSSARDQFEYDKPGFPAMIYEPVSKTFLLYEGVPDTPQFNIKPSVGRIFRITPNAGAVWDMSLFEYAAGAANPPPTYYAGLCNRMFYLSQYKGVVMMPDMNQNLQFMKLS